MIITNFISISVVYKWAMWLRNKVQSWITCLFGNQKKKKKTDLKNTFYVLSWKNAHLAQTNQFVAYFSYTV